MERYHVSKGERELGSFLASIYSGSIELNSRRTIPPYELDILLPELSLAVEFNGDFYHSEEFIRKKSGGLLGAREKHELKRSLARDQGIELAMVWERDWYGPNRSQVELALRELLEIGRLEPILDKMTADDEANGS